MDEKIELEIDAIKTILKALEPLDDDVRTNVLEYVLKKLNMSVNEILGSSTIPRELVQEPTKHSPEPNSEMPTGMHIREFKELKAPKSAMEMAAIVAYYLQYVVQESERRDSITSADIETWFRIADYPLPNIQYVLPNTRNAGYVDSATGTGAYKLNAVGYNLVKHSLPRKGNETPVKRNRKAAKKTGKKTSKK